jgi:hypothetical protein
MSDSTSTAGSEPMTRSLPQRFAAEWQRHDRTWALYSAGAAFVVLALFALDVLPDAFTFDGTMTDDTMIGLVFGAGALALFFAATASGLEERSNDGGSLS